MNVKPLGIKAYGHIPHIAGSRRGPGDHGYPKGQSEICTAKPRDQYDQIIVQEKLDGACVAVARIGAHILPLNRAGYLAASSTWEHHRMFHAWAWDNRGRFMSLLRDGERVVGEWMALAHGTRYRVGQFFEPFQMFDIMVGTERLPFTELTRRRGRMLTPFHAPSFLGFGPMAPGVAIAKIYNPWLNDKPEGVVYRVERNGKVDFLAKYVRPDKVGGCYLPEVTGESPVWNWKPASW